MSFCFPLVGHEAATSAVKLGERGFPSNEILLVASGGQEEDDRASCVWAYLLEQVARETIRGQLRLVENCKFRNNPFFHSQGKNSVLFAVSGDCSANSIQTFFITQMSRLHKSLISTELMIMNVAEVASYCEWTDGLEPVLWDSAIFYQRLSAKKDIKMRVVN